MLLGFIAVTVTFFFYSLLRFSQEKYLSFFKKQKVLSRLALVSNYGSKAKTPQIPPKFFLPLIRLVEKLLVETKIGSNFTQLMAEARFSRSPLKIVSYLFFLTLLLLFIGIFGGSFFLGFLLAFIPSFSFYFWLKYQKRKIKQQFTSQLPEAISFMMNALGAGASLTQAIIHAAKESPFPIRDELQKLGEELQIGLSLEQALEKFKKRLNLPELEIVIATLLVQKKTGGNLVKLLSQTRNNLKEQIELENELRTQTAQTRLSGKIIGLLPLIIIVSLTLLDRDFIAPLFNTNLGVILLLLASFAEIAGFLLIRKILQIEF